MGAVLHLTRPDIALLRRALPAVRLQSHQPGLRDAHCRVQVAGAQVSISRASWAEGPRRLPREQGGRAERQQASVPAVQRGAQDQIPGRCAAVPQLSMLGCRCVMANAFTPLARRRALYALWAQSHLRMVGGSVGCACGPRWGGGCGPCIGALACTLFLNDCVITITPLFNCLVVPPSATAANECTPRLPLHAAGRAACSDTAAV